MSSRRPFGGLTPALLLEAVEAMRDPLGGRTIPWGLLDRLYALIPTDEIAFVQMDYSRNCFTSHQGIDAGQHFDLGEADGRDHPWWKWCQDPANPLQLLNVRTDVLRWSRYFSLGEIRRWPIYSEYWRGVGDAMLVDFPAPPSHKRRLLFWRCDTDRFTESDEALVRLIRPHLFEIDKNFRHVVNNADNLTARQRQVLHLLAEGRSNTEIAELLVVSVATVRKHVEHILLLAQVHSRGAAVAKLLP